MKADFSAFNCSLAQTLSVVGDGWSLLIVRNAWLGLTRFGEFQSSLGIAKNILADRLDRLVGSGVLVRGGTTKRPTYHLSERGRDLLPVLVAMMQWGDRWLSHAPPMTLVGPEGDEVLPIELRTERAALGTSSVRFAPGPGATAQTKDFLRRYAPGSLP